MKTATAALFLALAAAACSPTERIPAGQAQAQSQPPAVSMIAYPEIASDASDGQVYDYH